MQAFSLQLREFEFRYRSAEHWLDTFRAYYGPIHNAFAALDPAGQRAFELDLLAIANTYNTSRADGLRVPSAYVEVVARRR